MRKITKIVPVLVLVAALLSSCAAKESGPVTLRTSIDKNNPKIWLHALSLDGRSTKIIGAYIFKEDAVESYIIYDKTMLQETDALGYLEDYYSLNDEETIDLIKEKYESSHRAHYEKLMEKEVPGIKEDAEYHGRSPEEEPYKTRISEITKTYDELKETVFDGNEPKDYDIVLHKDSSGNGVSYEEFTTDATLGRMYKGYYTIAGSVPYHVIEEEDAEINIAIDEQQAPFEVYDTYYGGFRCMGDGITTYLLTKCKEDTEFVLDSLGTRGTVEK